MPYEDIAGLKEARDYGWLKILPAKPKKFLNLIRTFLGSQKKLIRIKMGNWLTLHTNK